MNPEHIPSAIGMDLGGHTLGAALVRGATLAERAEVPTPEGRSLEAVLEAMVRLAHRLAPSGTPVGVGLPGMIDAPREHFLRGPNFPGWSGLPLRHLLEERLQAPVRLENDANCYALGEGFAGAARGLRDYVVFTLGTGIGGGVVCSGGLLRGAHGMGGELGHLSIGGLRPCGCGGKGHLETVAAADGLETRGRKRGLPADARELWLRRARDPEAHAVWQESLEALAEGVVSVIHTFDPEAVVLGGGMSAAPGLLDVLRPLVEERLSDPFRPLLDLRLSTLGNAAALWGAAALWLSPEISWSGAPRTGTFGDR